MRAVSRRGESSPIRWFGRSARSTSDTQIPGASRNYGRSSASTYGWRGTQSAIDLAIRVLLDREAEVWVEDPGYLLTHQALETAGVSIRHIPVDTDGMDVGAGRRIAPKARAAFVTASHQFPLGVVLTMSRRLDLLA